LFIFRSMLLNSFNKQERFMKDREIFFIIEHQNTNDEFYYSLFSMALAVNTKEHGSMNSKDFKSTAMKMK
jgi:hemerythrin